MFCNRCGTEAPLDASFCATCGLDLNGTTPMSAIKVFERDSDLEVVRTSLRSEYDVKEEIGRGGMATVYRAVEAGLAREVALKVLPFSHTHDQNLVERFQLEARTAAKLEHPNIIPIYRVGRADQVIYFAMRYLRGPSLTELIDQVGPMEPAKIRRILIESARALGHAHRQNVVHRDIKPDNIMFKDNGEAVVCDFGIAKAASGTGLTGTGMAIGTPYYMSPEQVRAKPLDGRSDIYSLGVVAYQCLTTRVPFDGDDSFAIGYKHVMDDVPVPELKSDDHQALFQVIRRMMEKHPDDRFATADALVDALEGRAGGLPITAVSPVATNALEGLPDTIKSPAIDVKRTMPRSSIMTPTTPVPRVTVEAEVDTPRRRPLRIAAALAGAFFLTVGGGVGGGYVYLENGGEIPAGLRRYEPVLRERAPWLAEQLPLDRWLATDARVDSVPVDSVALATSTVALDSTNDTTMVTDSLIGTDSLPDPDSTVVAAAPDTASVDSTTGPAGPAEPAEPVTGVLVVANLGSRATLWINGTNVRGLRHELPAGSHEIRVAAPGYERYEAEVDVVAGETVRHRVNMRQVSQCERFGPTYNQNNECFDRRARLDPRASTLVPVDGTVPTQPTQPVELVIEVKPDGTAGAVVVRSPSDVPEFALLVVKYAKGLAFDPATLGGQPVTAWAVVAFYAQP